MVRDFLQSILSSLKRHMLRGEEPATAPEPPETQGPPSEVDIFKERLAHMTNDNEALLRGALQRIDLAEVRDALGTHWDVLAPQVMASADRQIRRWTGPADEVRAHGDAGFLIGFGDLGDHSADQQVSRLALRVKAGLVEQFPQLAGKSPHPAVPGAELAAHQVMATQIEKSEEIRRREAGRGTDPRLWRSALGQAALELLEAGAQITADELIARLEAGRRDEDLVLTAASIDAAVIRLRAIAALSRAADEEASDGTSEGPDRAAST